MNPWIYKSFPCPSSQRLVHVNLSNSIKKKFTCSLSRIAVGQVIAPRYFREGRLSVILCSHQTQVNKHPFTVSFEDRHFVTHTNHFRIIQIVLFAPTTTNWPCIINCRDESWHHPLSPRLVNKDLITVKKKTPHAISIRFKYRFMDNHLPIIDCIINAHPIIRRCDPKLDTIKNRFTLCNQ